MYSIHRVVDRRYQIFLLGSLVFAGCSRPSDSASLASLSFAPRLLGAVDSGYIPPSTDSGSGNDTGVIAAPLPSTSGSPTSTTGSTTGTATGGTTTNPTGDSLGGNLSDPASTGGAPTSTTTSTSTTGTGAIDGSDGGAIAAPPTSSGSDAGTIASGTTTPSGTNSGTSAGGTTSTSSGSTSGSGSSYSGATPVSTGTGTNTGTGTGDGGVVVASNPGSGADGGNITGSTSGMPTSGGNTGSSGDGGVIGTSGGTGTSSDGGNVPPSNSGSSTGGSGGGSLGSPGGSPGGSSGPGSGDNGENGSCSASAETIGDGVILLDAAAPQTLTMNGNGKLWVTAPVQVNSVSETAGFFVGNAYLKTPALQLAGNYVLNGNPIIDSAAAISIHQPKILDPLRFLPAPTASSQVVRSQRALKLTQGNMSLQPGIYVGGIFISGQASVTMAPGIYFMKGGGFTFAGQGNLSATNVMIYNDPQLPSDAVKITGKGSVVMSPPADGTYFGISLFQRRDSAVGIQVAGNGNYQMSGTFYGASAPVKISGNGVAVVGSQYISRTLAVRGNGDFHIDWRASMAPAGCVAGDQF